MRKNSARNVGDATGIRRRGTRSEGSERLRERRGAQAAAADEAERGGDRAWALTWHRMNTPLRTSHEPRRGSFPHTTRFWPHSVQYLIRKPTVVFGMTLICPFANTIAPTTRIIALAPSPTLRITRLNRPESPRIRSQSTSMRTRPDRVSLPPVDAPGYPVPDEGRMGFPWKSNKKARRKQVFPRRKSAPRSYGFCSSGRQIVNKPSSLGQVERNS